MQISDARMTQMGRDFYAMSKDASVPEHLREKAAGHSQYIYDSLHQKKRK